MCIIAIKPKGKPMFPERSIRTMFANNPDGSGFMYCRNGKVVIEKGYMTAESLLARLQRTDLTDFNVVIHFRIGTSGLNNKLNCHPYPIYRKNSLACECDLGMAHNGILHGYVPSRYSKVNDTQVFIANVISNLRKGWQYNPDVLMLIEELIGSNRLAFLDNQGHLTLIGEYIEDDGYIYSNTSYRVLKQAKKSPVFTLSEEDNEMDLWDELENERKRGRI